MTRAALLYVLVVLGAACGGEYRPARTKYNEGVAAMAAGKFDEASKALLAARGEAGVDPELRFRAAYDLGVAYAALADQTRRADQPDLKQALDHAQQAMSWLGDAARQRPGDVAAKANLAIVRARVQAISDELRKGEGKLEARLDAVIKDQRELLDGVRTAWLAIRDEGGTDPLAQQTTVVGLADRERGIVAEVGSISDLAADEIDDIGKKKEEERSDEEKVRVVQLKGLDIFLLEARARIAEARRKLQDLATEDALGRAEAALVALKRAREQLLDPITVLQGVAQDQVALLRDTAQATVGSPPIALGAPPAPTARAAAAPAAWLEPPVLGERQAGLRQRLEEVRARLQAAADQPAPASDAAAPQDPQAAQQAKTLVRVRLALPHIVTASGAMSDARQALAERQLAPAQANERAALAALARAIEEFSDLKQTVELAYAEQEQITGLLGAAGAQLPVAERGTETREALTRNLGRMTRLQGLISDEVTQLAQTAAQPAPSAPAAGPPGTPASPTPEQLEAQKQKLAQAETLRGEAHVAIDQLVAALQANGDPQAPATTAQAKLRELRMLFFSLIEHLQQLVRDQGETRDQTAALTAVDDAERRGKLPAVIAREAQHGGMATAITDELAKQADAAGKEPAQPPQPGQPDAKALAAAAAEMRLAQAAIGDARGALAKVLGATQTSESLDPAVAQESTALEHLEAALRLLQPPQEQNQDSQQNQDQQQQQQQQQRAGAGQSARDQDAAQQKKRREREAGNEPVEQDW